MSVYGDTLLAFPEQFRSLEVFDMTAKVNGGWTITEDSAVTIRGLYQNTRGKQIKDSNGNLVFSQGFELWTKTGNLDGKFCKINNIVYRLSGSNGWGSEAGFTRYMLEKVVGNDGTESVVTSWNLGADSFG